jgi:curved DNA-binding protein CbpA
MSRAFQYKPRFVDIRVRPPKEGETEAPPDVFTLKPGEKVCDHPDCHLAGSAKAPKSRVMLNEHYWFCQAHAAEYNKSWDFFAGMSEGEVRARREEESMTGGRPTWSFKASANSRESMAKAKGPEGWTDSFGIFSAARRKAEQAAETSGRRIGKLERAALADLDLPDVADGPAIRARYLDLVKRCHPDSNGGDRSAEHKLQRVIKAYKTLRKSGLVES